MSKIVKILGYGAAALVCGFATATQTNYEVNDYIAVFRQPLESSSWSPLILTAITVLTTWQTFVSIVRKPATVEGQKILGKKIDVAHKKITENRTIIRDESTKIRLQVSEEAQQILEAIERSAHQKLDAAAKKNLSGIIAEIIKSGDARKEEAKTALREGRPKDAAAHLLKVGLQEAAATDDLARSSVDTFREAGQLYYLFDTDMAIESYENVLKYGSKHVWDYIHLSRLYQQGGNIEAAEQAAKSAQGIANSDREKSVISVELGNIAQAWGNLEIAREFYTDGLKIDKARSARDHKNTECRRGVSVSYNKLGDIATAQNDIKAARRFYANGLRIRKKLYARDRQNMEYQRDVSVSYNKLGDIAKARNELKVARRFYADGLKIRKKLSALDRKNTEYRRDVSISYNKLGSVAKAENDHGGALKYYPVALNITKTLSEQDSGNAGYQRDLVTSYVKLAELDGKKAQRHWNKAYQVLKALNDKGRMVPTDREKLEFLRGKANVD